MVTLVALPLLLLMMSGTQAFAATAATQQVTLGMSGQISNAGSQVYYNSGGSLAAAFILGNAIDVSSAHVSFNIIATVTGIRASGFAFLHLDGSTMPTSGPAQPVEVDALVTISSMLSAEPFPLGCGEPGTVPAAPCTSAVPGFYLGSAQTTISVGKATQHVNLPVALESAFLNPFGAPILFTSSESATPAIFLVTTYNHANIIWHGVKLAGSVAGTGSTKATGQFVLTTDAQEDLFAGTEHEYGGSWTFLDMAPSSLNAQGSFSGSSTIPPPGPGSDCSSLTGVPGTCSLTGFVSKGEFDTRTTSHANLDGSYVTTWAVPALTFTSAVSASLSQH